MALAVLVSEIEMHIAEIAPLAESVPPSLYGGTERVVSWLTEELVDLGRRSHCLQAEVQKQKPNSLPSVPSPYD
jgi:hypothetical protein